MRRIALFLVSAIALATTILPAQGGAARRRPAAHRAPASDALRPAGMLEAMGNVRDEHIRADVKYLASDALEGRGTGAHGGDVAAEYIAQQFQAAGLQPAGDNGTWFQKVPMVGITTEPASTMQVITPKQSLELKLADDVMLFNLDGKKTVDLDAPVVFVGYGIQAPEFGWDDYAGVDVKGKILLMFVNEPPSDDPKFFGGKALTYYGRWTYKYEQAARMGAAGVILIHRSDMASYGWQVVRSSWSGEHSQLAEDKAPKLALASWIHLDKARAVLADAGEDLDALLAASQKKGFRAKPLPLTVKAHLVSQVRYFASNNVLGKLPGSDPELSKQAIFFTGHYDHLGMRETPAGKIIYHGALDNATGTAMVMEMARAMGAAHDRPKRTVYFAAVTAEEQGLWGSEYLAQHLPVPAASVSLDLNYDAIAPLGIPKQLVAQGYERTTLAKVVEQTAADFKMTILAPQHPENGGYYRSDHFSFAHYGIPAFSIEAGEKFTGHTEAWVKAKGEEMEKSYHQPSDEFKEDYDYRTNAVLARFGIALAYRAGVLPHNVEWLPGEEFEAARKASEAR